MRKRNSYTLTETELKQIRVAMKHQDSRVSKRATIIHRLHLGDKHEDIARSHDVSVASVYNYYNNFKDEGVNRLEDRPRSGRPRKASPEYITLLEDTLERDPQELGFAFTVWTQKRLRTYLAAQTDISLSRARFHELMKELGYVYRRPKHDVAHQQNASLREQAVEALDELKKEPKPIKLSYSLWTKA